jgi:hypothetical protein
MSDDPAKDAMRAAFAALLKGDTKERDRQCGRATRIIEAEQKPPVINLVRQPDGSFAAEIKRHG